MITPYISKGEIAVALLLPNRPYGAAVLEKSKMTSNTKPADDEHTVAPFFLNFQYYILVTKYYLEVKVQAWVY